MMSLPHLCSQYSRFIHFYDCPNSPVDISVPAVQSVVLFARWYLPHIIAFGILQIYISVFSHFFFLLSLVK